MNITISGKITHVLTPKKGVSQRTGNEWVSQEFVIEDADGTSLCFNVFGADTIQKYGLKIGSIASVTCEIKSSEWSGRWFTNVSCQSCITQGENKQNKTQQVAQEKREIYNEPKQDENVSADDLPF